MPDSTCRLCKTLLLVPDQSSGSVAGVCNRCRDRLGLIPMPPQRRRAAPCQRCSGMKFVRVIPREYGEFGNSSAYPGEVMPMTATQLPHVHGNSVVAPSRDGGRGLLENYICMTCGFIEWYCIDPQRIPIGPEFMTEVVDHDQGGPYR
jgi:hypothetical protein